jgi:pyruvate,orthophosphate dikinase
VLKNKTWISLSSSAGNDNRLVANLRREKTIFSPSRPRHATNFRKTGNFPEGLWDQMLAALKVTEKNAGKKFGDPTNPLLVSCRSGAKFSMPGMMNTILNIGLTDEVVEGMIKLTGNPRFVWDSYRRLVEMFGTTVFNLDDEVFEHPMANTKPRRATSSTPK